MLGDCDYCNGGGVEVVSRVMYGPLAMRSVERMGNNKMLDDYKYDIEKLGVYQKAVP